MIRATGKQMPVLLRARRRLRSGCPATPPDRSPCAKAVHPDSAADSVWCAGEPERIIVRYSNSLYLNNIFIYRSMARGLLWRYYCFSKA
jgi:hypothetical protein